MSTTKNQRAWVIASRLEELARRYQHSVDVQSAKTAKLRAIAKLCRCVLMVKLDGRRSSDVGFRRVQRMAEKVLDIIRQKGAR
jgi:hypothetical protein